MTEPKLKPCPFCGSEAITFEDKPIMGWFIACDNEKCRANVGYFDTKQEAIEVWNHRVESDKE